jgi:peptidyl-prolyl cis-trans isomerase D
MFNTIRNNKKIIQLVLAIIILPFALWGVDSYVRNTGGADIATVGGTSIAQEEFQRSLSEQQDRLRPQLGGNTALLESPEFRNGVLQELINRRLLLLYANKAQMGVSNETLSGFISSLPALQVDGKFSRAQYESLVAAQNMSIEQFEGMLKRDLLMQQATLAVGNAAVSGRLPTDRWLAAQLEEREIGETMLRAEQFAGDSKPDAAAVKRYYEENRARFEQPEQVRVEYLVLNQNKAIESAKVSDGDIKAWYQANEARYKKPEQRRASHILIRADKNAPEAEIKAAEEKAGQILAQLKANPADFAKLAKQHSQDPGSAANGGDLGFFGRGMMVKPFEEATFGLKENQLSEVVRSDFGFHLIKLTGVRAEQAQPLDEVRGEILTELKRQAGAKQYAEAAEGFTNMVYEQSDSLKPTAEKYGLSIQSSEWLAKGGQLMPPFTNPKLAQAIFSDDAVKNKRNTEAIEAAPNTLVSARVVEHRPAAVEPLEAVAGVIEKVLAREAAVAKAAAAGQAELDKLNKGEKANLAWATVRTISRLHAPNLSAEARAAVFAADTKKLPSYAGVKTSGGFALYRIDKVKPFDPAAESEVAARALALRQKYGEVLAQEDMVNWLATLRQQYGVKINGAALERK